MSRKSEAGLGMWGWLYVIGTAVMLGVFGMKSGPVYLNDFSIAGVMKKIVAQPEIASTSPTDIRKAFDRYADTSYLKYVTGADVKIKANPKGGRLMELKYEVRLPMVYNVEAIYKFEHRVEIPSP